MVFAGRRLPRQAHCLRVIGPDGCVRRPQEVNLSEQKSARSVLDMKVLDTKIHPNKRLTMKVLLGLVVAGCVLPMQLGAQVSYSIDSFVGCLASISSANPTVVDAVNTCVPSGCYFTNTMSEESAQNACKLRDGTRLP